MRSTSGRSIARCVSALICSFLHCFALGDLCCSISRTLNSSVHHPLLPFTGSRCFFCSCFLLLSLSLCCLRHASASIVASRAECDWCCCFPMSPRLVHQTAKFNAKLWRAMIIPRISVRTCHSRAGRPLCSRRLAPSTNMVCKYDKVRSDRPLRAAEFLVNLVRVK